MANHVTRFQSALKEKKVDRALFSDNSDSMGRNITDFRPRTVTLEVEVAGSTYTLTRTETPGRGRFPLNLFSGKTTYGGTVTENGSVEVLRPQDAKKMYDTIHDEIDIVWTNTKYPNGFYLK